MPGRTRLNTRFRPIETVFLPGDEELYGEYIKNEGRFNRVPHDHLAYSTRRRREQDVSDEYELLRLREMIQRAREALRQIEEAE